MAARSSEASATALEHESHEAWAGARDYARHLASGGAPAVLAGVGLALRPGEQASIHTSADHARFHGEGPSTPLGRRGAPAGIPWGAAALASRSVVGAVALTVAGRARARRRAAPRWRPVGEVGVVATDQRLACRTGTAGWVSFWWPSVVELRPEPTSWSLVLVVADAAPVRLTGLAAPALCVHATHVVLPERWTHHPAMAPLLS